MKKCTIKDVARAAGVSTTVVSKVINARRRPDGTLDCIDTSRETAERVMKIVQEMDYKPSRFAAGLRRGKRYVIGVITPDISNNAFSSGCRMIEELAHADGYTVMFGSSAESPVKMSELIDIFMANGVDGMIVIPCAGSESILHKLAATHIPVVLSNRDIPSIEGVGRVFQNNRKAIRLLIDNFVQNGYSRIAMVSEKIQVSSLQDREESFRESMEAYGLEPVFYFADTEKVPEQVPQFVKDAYERGIEAIIAPRMPLALYSLQGIKELGLKIPQQMGLVGHDDSPLFTYYDPSITYVSQTSDAVGREAYKMLFSMMSGGEPSTVLIEPSVVFGESTARR